MIKNGKTKKTLILGACLIVFAVPLFSRAETYNFYVDKNYDGEEDGSKSKPFNTLEEAVEEAASNSAGSRKIFVENGKYEGRVILGNSVKIYGESKSGVIIKNMLTMKNDTLIKNITIDGDFTNVVVEKDADARIENCNIKNSSGSGIDASAGSGKVIVKNSSIYNNVLKGMYIQAGKKIEITGNEIYDNKGEGIDIRAKVSGTVAGNKIHGNSESGIELIVGSSSLFISDNTIRNNGASGIATQFYEGSSKIGEIEIIENIINGNKKYGIDCSIPSGGYPSKNYWEKSIQLADNELKKNGKTINNSCKISEVVEVESDKTGDIQNASVNETEELNSENESATEEKLQAEVKAAEKENRENEVREQMMVIMEQGNKLKEKVNGEIETVEKRNKIKTFFIGADHKDLDVLKNDVEQHKSQAEQLRGLYEKAEREENKLTLQEQMRALEQERERIQSVISACENKFSLFGWLIRLFAK